MLNLKICGVNNLNFLKEILLIEEIKFLGFIFYDKSPRNVNVKFLDSIKKINFGDKRPVCVYVDAQKEFVENTCSYFDNPILQFHGNETNLFCKSFSMDFWKTIHVKNKQSLRNISNYQNADGILLETYKKDKFGGTGESFDWNLIKNIKNLDTKIILSGGINIENIHNAYKIKPWCIDINSGVEKSLGVKDINLVKKIIKKLNNEII